MSVKIVYSDKGGFYILFASDASCILTSGDMKHLSKLLKEEGF